MYVRVIRIRLRSPRRNRENATETPRRRRRRDRSMARSTDFHLTRSRASTSRVATLVSISDQWRIATPSVIIANVESTLTRTSHTTYSKRLTARFESFCSRNLPSKIHGYIIFICIFLTDMITQLKKRYICICQRSWTIRMLSKGLSHRAVGHLSKASTNRKCTWTISIEFGEYISNLWDKCAILNHLVACNQRKRTRIRICEKYSVVPFESIQSSLELKTPVARIVSLQTTPLYSSWYPVPGNKTQRMMFNIRLDPRPGYTYEFGCLWKFYLKNRQDNIHLKLTKQI